jgi:hypothetical protein
MKSLLDIYLDQQELIILLERRKKKIRKLLLNFISNKCGKIKGHFRFLFTYKISQVKVELFFSKFDCEVILIVADSSGMEKLYPLREQNQNKPYKRLE